MSHLPTPRVRGRSFPPTTPLRSAADATERAVRRWFFGTPVHRWKATEWVHGRVVRFVQSGHGGDLAVAFRGARFSVAATDAGSAPMLRDGTFERGELDAWLAILRPGWTVVDVGANIGIYSVLSAMAVGAAGRVIAVEPEPGNHARLIGNLDRNGVTNAEVVQACAGDAPGIARLHLARGNAGAHSIVRRAASGTSIPCPTVTLDSVLEGAAVHALKIDVEGFETEVLRGARTTIRRCRPVVLIEFNAETPILSVVRELMEDGYGSCRLIRRGKMTRMSVDDLESLPRRPFLGSLLLEAADSPGAARVRRDRVRTAGSLRRRSR